MVWSRLDIVRRRGLLHQLYLLNHLLYQSDWILRPDGATSEDSGIESAETPAQTRRVAGLHLSVENGLLDSWAVHVECGARCAPFGELEEDFAGAETLADTHLPPVEAERRQVLTQCARKQRQTLRDQLVDALGRDKQQGLVGAAVNIG